MIKKMLLLGVLLMIYSCVKDDPEILITKMATILIDPSQVDNCHYSIRTEDKEYFSTDDLPGEYAEETFEARITYRKTQERMNCGFSGSLIKIEITDLQKI